MHTALLYCGFVLLMFSIPHCVLNSEALFCNGWTIYIFHMSANLLSYVCTWDLARWGL